MTEPAMILHGYFRSSASYRVRIALNLKGVPYRSIAHNLRTNEHQLPDFVALNPQGLVPALQTPAGVLTQSLAICEWLDETIPQPALLPADPLARARVRAFALAIACEVHPVQNLGTLRRLTRYGVEQAQTEQWAREVIDEGLQACATLIADQSGPYCFGDTVTLADLCLVPQLANARRFGARLDWPRLQEIEANCLSLEAFAKASPEQQEQAG